MIKFLETELPSNRNFGFFFSTIFAVTSVYFYFSQYATVAYVLITLSLVFFVITCFKSDALLPLNRYWMKLGLLLGLVFSPIILALIYFGLLTPIALLIRAIGRDELQLKLHSSASYWILRNDSITSDSFKEQF